jgi:hypothetical protein
MLSQGRAQLGAHPRRAALKGPTMLRTLPAALIALGAALPAAAQSVSAHYPQSIVDALRDAGYKAVLTVDDVGDPKIDSAASGVSYSIWFYGCDGSGERCTDVQFFAGFNLDAPLDPMTMNDWNRDNNIGTAYLDEEGDPFIRHHIFSLDGYPRPAFDGFLSVWERALADFKVLIGW